MTIKRARQYLRAAAGLFLGASVLEGSPGGLPSVALFIAAELCSRWLTEEKTAADHAGEDSPGRLPAGPPTPPAGAPNNHFRPRAAIGATSATNPKPTNHQNSHPTYPTMHYTNHPSPGNSFPMPSKPRHADHAAIVALIGKALRDGPQRPGQLESRVQQLATATLPVLPADYHAVLRKMFLRHTLVQTGNLVSIREI